MLTNYFFRESIIYTFRRTTMNSFVIVVTVFPFSLVGELSDGITLLWIFLVNVVTWCRLCSFASSTNISSVFKYTPLTVLFPTTQN